MFNKKKYNIDNLYGNKLYKKTVLQYSKKIVLKIQENPNQVYDILKKMKMSKYDFYDIIIGKKNANIAFYDTVLSFLENKQK